MAGLDFDYATGEDVDGGTPPRYAELMEFQILATTTFGRRAAGSSHSTAGVAGEPPAVNFNPTRFQCPSG